MLALASIENWHIEGLDVQSAYLYGKLEEEIYMKQPEGFTVKGQEHKVLRLKHALYSLKQAGLAWWETLNESMKDLGFECLKSNAGIFLYKRKGTTTVIAIVYVDDALFCGPDIKTVKEIKAAFLKHWECRDLGPAKEFLHMNIRQEGSKIMIDQCAYLEKILQRFNLVNAQIAPIPLPQGYHPMAHEGVIDPKIRSLFQQVIGSLLYLMFRTHPDIAYTVITLSKHAANPSKEHLDHTFYICRYLLGTQYYSLVFDGSTKAGLITYTDSDWASDPNTQHSQTGWFIKLAG